MTRNWTNEQLEAIDRSGTNIIVSAGAGSGKTAVLTQRVIKKLKSGISIDSLLVLTFTKASSQEMKERIRAEIKKDDFLKNQLSLIDASYITTFDSYALSIVKKYGYLINISPRVSISDSSILKMEKEKMIEDIFEELYKNKDDSFLKLIGDFCVKDDATIKNYIIKMNDKLDMLYDRDNYLFNYVEESFNKSKIDDDILLFTDIIKGRCEQIKELQQKIGNYVDSEYYELLEASLNHLLNAHTYDEFKNEIDIMLPKLSKKDDEAAKEYRDQINDIIKELNNMCVWNNIEDIKSSILSTKDYVKAIINVITKLDEKIKQYKYEHDLYEFSDIANISIKLVKENSDIREELTNTFNEILVDEYQDTNDLQEEFISLIGNNNVYMVGDIKQSIYRFRNANPNIFKNKYELYKHNAGGIKIDLNKNFRSRSEVLNNINLIFDDIMDSTFGGADYRLEHRLEFGNETFNGNGKTNQNQDLEICNYLFDKDLGFKKEELEAFIVVHDIKNKIDNHYQIFDMKNQCLRDVKYSDFCILMDRSVQFDLYKKIFTFMNIPLMVHKDENVASTSDILAVKSILKLILCLKNNKSNEEFKYAFMSVGRSFICEYSDDDLFSFFINNSYKDTELFKKAYEISKMADAIGIDAILSMVVKEFDIYKHTIKIGNVSEMILRVDYLIENAASLAAIGYNLEMFVSYLDENLSAKSDIKIPSSREGTDACSIMTIHKSKGLEYNICYYTGIYAEFNISDLKELFYYDNHYGIITPYFNEGINHTIYKRLLKEKYLKEEIEEKLRLFYVALTRCREKMIIVADLDSKDISYDRDENGLITLSSRLGYRSFRDIILSVKENLNPNIKNIEINNMVETDYNTKQLFDYKKRIPTTNVEIEDNTIIIESRQIVSTTYSKKINALLDKDVVEAMKIGKLVHYYLEIIDFNNPVFDNIDAFYQKKIISFLNQDILKDVDKSKIYKEYEFIYDDEDGEHHGIIDLILEFDDHIKIIDYKLKDTDSKAYENQLKGYQKYIESISTKKTELYLYSIIDEQYKRIV